MYDWSMADPLEIQQSPGGGLSLLMSDGARRLAYPLPNGSWLLEQTSGAPPVDPGTPGEGWRWPFPERTITDGYGNLPERFHVAVDFGNAPALNNAPIRAAGPGTVRENRWNDWWGNYISIDHGVIAPHGRVTTNYCHMIAPGRVKVGSKVDINTVIGNIGNTGQSRGAHLHFMVCQNGTNDNSDTTNPIPFLIARKAVGR